MKDFTKEEMIQKIKEIASINNTNKVPRHRFFQETGISERKVLSLFGSYNSFILEAGLEPTIFPKKDNNLYSDDELLKEVIKVCRMPDANFTRVFFDQNSLVSSSSVCERRFGGWSGTLELILGKLDIENDKELIQKIKNHLCNISKQSFPPKKQIDKIEAQIVDDEFTKTSENNNENELFTPLTEIDTYEKDSLNIYGDFINFRGLQHAPVNEQGVVFLFGMICRELGYIVEIVRQGFPDCEAKRKIKGKLDKWQKVRIEFEFHSRSFRQHGHDPNRCDIIVCWEHNWSDCPLEVLELKSIIKHIENGA